MEFTVGSSNQAVTKLPAEPVAHSVRPSPKRTAVAQAYGVQEGEGVRASGGPEADLVAAVAPHLALRAVALALRAHILAERDVVERALRLDLGLHAVRHALVRSVEAVSSVRPLTGSAV